MKDIDTYIAEVYAKAETMPEMEKIVWPWEEPWYKRLIRRITGNFICDDEKFYILPTIEKCTETKSFLLHWFYIALIITYGKTNDENY